MYRLAHQQESVSNPPLMGAAVLPGFFVSDSSASWIKGSLHLDESLKLSWVSRLNVADTKTRIPYVNLASYKKRVFPRKTMYTILGVCRLAHRYKSVYDPLVMG